MATWRMPGFRTDDVGCLDTRYRDAKDAQTARKAPALHSNLPKGHGLLEEAGEVVGAGGARRELRHAVLGQRAFDERGDIRGLVAEFAKAVGNLQIAH